jgi:predicted metal-dependent enzyme (double-stranded beta helix superfamily)
MVIQDWLVTHEGNSVEAEIADAAEVYAAHTTDTADDSRPYRLYRFLTDLENILDRVKDDQLRLRFICPLVRRLLTSSEWLQMNFLPPDPATGWSVVRLYNEPDFPITIQTVTWAPGSTSPVHNHATWGIVALLSGQEKNTFWRRSPTHADRIEPTSDRLLVPGDILCLMPDAIHQVEAMGDEPTISFNLYGETDFAQRFEFDIEQQTSRLF